MTLESRVRQMQVFNLPHHAYCKGGCACRDTVMVVVAENPRTGERALRHVSRKTPSSMTLLARERRSGLPAALLEVPEVKAAIARRLVRVVEQTPDKPGPAARPPAAPTSAPAAPTPGMPATPAPAPAAPPTAKGSPPAAASGPGKEK